MAPPWGRRSGFAWGIREGAGGAAGFPPLAVGTQAIHLRPHNDFFFCPITNYLVYLQKETTQTEPRKHLGIKVDTSQAIVRFLHYIRAVRRLSDRTVQAYEDTLREFHAFLPRQAEEVEAISPALVREWQMRQAERGLKATTIRAQLSALRTFFKFLRKEKIIHEDVMARIVSPRLPQHLPISFREKETEKIYQRDNFPEGFGGTRDQLLLRLLYETGMRRAELTALTEDRVDTHNLTIKVLGKRNKERVIPIEKELARNIQEYSALKKQREGTSLRRAHSRKEQTIVWSNQLMVKDNGMPMTAADIYATVRRYMDMFSTAERRSPHIFRHSFASQMLNEGADLDAIKELLGHSDLAATEIYTHVTREHLKETYKHAHPRAVGRQKE